MSAAINAATAITEAVRPINEANGHTYVNNELKPDRSAVRLPLLVFWNIAEDVSTSYAYVVFAFQPEQIELREASIVTQWFVYARDAKMAVELEEMLLNEVQRATPLTSVGTGASDTGPHYATRTVNVRRTA